jgi:hypothetical protein
MQKPVEPSDLERYSFLSEPTITPKGDLIAITVLKAIWRRIDMKETSG